VRDPPNRQRLPWIRRPVRCEGAERYLLVTLVSFASTVILTRWFLTLTGFPRIGGGDLHIAPALWGAHLISFYTRQFDSIEVAIWHLVLLGAVIAYRDQLRTENARPVASDTT